MPAAVRGGHRCRCRSLEQGGFWFAGVQSGGSPVGRFVPPVAEGVTDAAGAFDAGASVSGAGARSDGASARDGVGEVG